MKCVRVQSALLLAAGAPGKRAALPSTTMMLRQPVQRFEQMQASDVDIYRNEIRCVSSDRYICVHMLPCRRCCCCSCVM